MLCAAVLVQPDVRRLAGTSKTVSQIYATIIGFAIVFRTNMAFGRFFEGVQFVQAMLSKWRDAFVALVCFIETSTAKHRENANSENEAQRLETAKIIEELVLSKARLLH